MIDLHLRLDEADVEFLKQESAQGGFESIDGYVTALLASRRLATAHEAELLGSIEKDSYRSGDDLRNRAKVRQAKAAG